MWSRSVSELVGKYQCLKAWRMNYFHLIYVWCIIIVHISVMKLQIPDQTESIHWVNFSSMEEYFYGMQKKACVTSLSAFTWPADKSLSSMTYNDMNKVYA